jgi:hypothetical protein
MPGGGQREAGQDCQAVHTGSKVAYICMDRQVREYTGYHAYHDSKSLVAPGGEQREAPHVALPSLLPLPELPRCSPLPLESYIYLALPSTPPTVTSMYSSPPNRSIASSLVRDFLLPFLRIESLACVGMNEKGQRRASERTGKVCALRARVTEGHKSYV